MYDVITQENVNTMPTYPRTKKRSKGFKNKNLATLWKSMSAKENENLKCKNDRRLRNIPRNDYIRTHILFDKHLRPEERSYRYAQAVDIEEMTTDNPTDFWCKLKNLHVTQGKTNRFLSK